MDGEEYTTESEPSSSHQITFLIKAAQAAQIRSSSLKDYAASCTATLVFPMPIVHAVSSSHNADRYEHISLQTIKHVRV